MTFLVGPRVSLTIAAYFGAKYEETINKNPKGRVYDAVGNATWTASTLGQYLFNWDISAFEKMLDGALKSGNIARMSQGILFKRVAVNLRIGRMYASYAHAGHTSIALAPAVMRQANFIGKMKGMGWLDAGRFDGGMKEAFLLRKAGARYHAFLDLMAAMPSGFLCPSEWLQGLVAISLTYLSTIALDIDLAWHTHQLRPDQYR